MLSSLQVLDHTLDKAACPGGFGLEGLNQIPCQDVQNGQFLTDSIMQILADAMLFFGSYFNDFPFEHFTLADIADDTSIELEMVNLADSQPNRKGLSIFMPSVYFTAYPDNTSLPSCDITMDVVVMLLTKGRGHEHGNVFSQHFRGSIPEELLGGRIDGLHDVLLVDGDDGIHSGHEDRHYRLKLGSGGSSSEDRGE